MEMRDILTSIQQGSRQFSCLGREVNDFANFQVIVSQLEEAQQLGFLEIIDLHREIYTGYRFVSAISVSPLTEQGEAHLATL